MTSSRGRAVRLLRGPMAAAFLFLQAGSWAAAPDKASSPVSGNADGGSVLSIMETAQLNFGKLEIGAGYMGGGPYFDEKHARREGLHAKLEIAVEGQPSQFTHASVREGQTLEVAGYRIFVTKITPGEKGTILLRLWAAPPEPKPAKSWRSWLGL